MHRLFTTRESLAQNVPELSRDARNHLNVLRPKDGEEFELFDGRGASRIFTFSRRENSLFAKSEIIFAKQRALALTLFACVTKGNRWEWLIEKATELGVSRIVPVLSARTIVALTDEKERLAKFSRWSRIVEEAARQSDAIYLPEMTRPLSFDESLALVCETNCFVGALTDEPSEPLLAALAKNENEIAKNGKPLAIFVGPEGDFTSEELAKLIKIATPVSFGPQILRAETAAIFGVSVLASALHRGLT